jgi:adenylate cyclase
LGRFHIEVDGQPLRFGRKAQRRPLELLKLLIALGGDSIPVEKMTDSLWPDSDGDQAQGAFDITLHRLRKQIGNDALQLADSRITLDPGQCWVDSQEFQETLGRAARAVEDEDGEGAWGYVEHALALYRGPFLEGEFLPVEILSARETLHGLFLRHIHQLAEFYLLARHHARATVLYQRGLEVDELAEEFYQGLMRCHGAVGHLGEVESLYQRCRKVLRAGADIDPSPETEAVYEALIFEQRVRLHDLAEGTASAASLLPGSISLELPDRPSIAVLPFANISGDPEQEYFSDGITEDLITDLSRLPSLAVIASNSSFTYKGKPADVRKVGKELGVRYVLEGSVRKSGGRVRITAQLIDATNGAHLWARRYDRELHDIFALQDEITRDIAAELEVELVYGEQGRAWHGATSNPEAYDLVLRGRQLWSRVNRANRARGRKMVEKALALDPGFAYAMVVLGRMCIGEGLGERTDSARAHFDRAIELGNQALALDDSLGDAHAMLCQAFKYKGEHDRAVEHGQQAVALHPYSADSNMFFSGVLQCVGRGEEAMDRIETALRLKPYPSAFCLRFLGGALMAVGRFEEAIAAFRKCVAGLPNMGSAHIGLTLAFMEAGEEGNAQAQALQVLRLRPGFSSSANPFVDSYKDPDTRERYMSLLRKAGLPE